MRRQHDGVLRDLRLNRLMYAMLVPGILWYLVFHYGPLWGVIIAFQDFKAHLGFVRSPWVGLAHFQQFFSGDFLILFRNTLLLAFSQIVVGFPTPIVLALMLNEVRVSAFKRSVQTITYLPHFLSWVVVYGITYLLLSTERGAINRAVGSLGGSSIPFLESASWFAPVYVAQAIWKNAGWGTVIYLAAITGVDQSLYEAAGMDGCGRFRKMWYVTLPSIRATIVVLLLLRIANLLRTNFEQVFLLQNALNRSASEVFDTYIYQVGLLQGFFSYATAIGLFASAVSLALLLTGDRLAKLLGEDGIL